MFLKLHKKKIYKTYKKKIYNPYLVFTVCSNAFFATMSLGIVTITYGGK